MSSVSLCLGLYLLVLDIDLSSPPELPWSQSPLAHGDLVGEGCGMVCSQAVLLAEYGGAGVYHPAGECGVAAKYIGDC